MSIMTWTSILKAENEEDSLDRSGRMPKGITVEDAMRRFDSKKGDGLEQYIKEVNRYVVNTDEYKNDYLNEVESKFVDDSLNKIKKYLKSLSKDIDTSFLNTLLVSIYETALELKRITKIKTPTTIVEASKIFEGIVRGEFKDKKIQESYIKMIKNIETSLEKFRNSPFSSNLDWAKKIDGLGNFLERIEKDSNDVMYFIQKKGKLIITTQPYKQQEGFVELKNLGRRINSILNSTLNDEDNEIFLRANYEEDILSRLLEINRPTKIVTVLFYRLNKEEKIAGYRGRFVEDMATLFSSTLDDPYSMAFELDDLDDIIAEYISSLDNVEDTISDEDLMNLNDRLKEENAELYESELNSNIKELEEYVNEYLETFIVKKQEIEKEFSPILDTLDDKERKRLKKTLQSVEPTEYFGQDFTRLGELIDMLKELDLIKSDNKMKKRFESIDERNIDMVALSSRLRKEYELLYRQLREVVYPKRKGDLRDE